LKHSLPIISWLVALAVLVGAALELRQQREFSATTVALQSIPQFQQSAVALTLADYQAIQSKISPIKSVTLVPAENSLTVSAAVLSDYTAWRLTIDRILSQQPSVHWRIDVLCSGQCTTGQAHKAVMVGHRMTAVVVTKNQENVISGTISAPLP
jgi:hypothetical protein